ncbi:MAG: right-handed parallel beta-helix repeat-containing protein [Thermoplasmatota archaeon]
MKETGRPLTHFVTALLIISSIGFIVHFSDHAEGSTLTVGSDQKYTTIQSAINSASSGDTIRIHAGTYEEDIKVSKKLTLIGNGSSETRIIGVSNSYVVTIGATSVKISDLSIKGDPDSTITCVLIKWDSHNLTLQNISVVDSYRGIKGWGKENQRLTGLTMRNCTVSGMKYYATYFSGLENCSFINNTFFDCQHGIYLPGEFNVDSICIEDCNISGNLAYDCEYGISLSKIDSTCITNNRIKNCDQGIYIEESVSSLVCSNLVRDYNKEGIVLKDDDNMTLRNNTIDGPGYSKSSANKGSGVRLLKSKRIKLLNNNFKDSGIFLEPTTTSETKWYNTHNFSGNKNNGKEIQYYHNRSSFSPASNAGQIIMAYCDHVNIEDQNIKNATTAVQLLECSDLNISNVTTEQCYFGIYIYNHQRDLSVYDRTINTSNNNTVIIDNSTYTNITECWSSGNIRNAIRISTDTKCENVHIWNNTIDETNNGIYLDKHYQSTSSAKYWRIENNSIGNISSHGMRLNMLRDSAVKNNTIQNSSNGVSILGSYKGWIKWPADGHEIWDNRISGGGTGIHVYISDDTRIAKNHITNTEDHGIYVESSGDPIVMKNTVKGCDETGIYLSGWDPEVKYNNISGPGKYGIRAYSNNGMKAWYNRIDNITKYGFYMDNSNHCSVKYNNLTRCGFFIWGTDLEDWNTNSYSQNKVNGRRMYFNRGNSGVTVPSGVGQVILFNCNNFKIKDQNLSHASVGVEIVYGNYNVIMNCSMDDNYYGVYTDRVGVYTNTYCTNNRIENNIIRNAAHTAVRLDHAGGSKVIDCNLSGAKKYGIWSYESDNLEVKNNTIFDVGFPTFRDGHYGFHMGKGCGNCDIEENRFRNCGLHLYRTDSISVTSSHTIINNTVNGRDLVYISQKNPSNYTKVPSGAGQVLIVKSSKVIVENQNLSYCGIGLYAYSSYSIIVRNCTFHWNIEGFGIHSFYPKTDYCLIENNSFSHAKKTGAKFHSYYSNSPSHNIFRNNTATDCGGEGFSFKFLANNNTIYNNHAARNGGCGIYIQMGGDGSRKCYVKNNTITENTKGGLYNTYGEGGTISGNTISRNGGDGIYMFETHKTKVHHNQVLGNDGHGMNLSFGNYNEFYRNLISDHPKYGLRIYNSWYVNKVYNNSFVYNGGSNSQAFDEGTYGEWDDGKYGNWWSNWTGPDSDDDGIVDVFYNIDGDKSRQDRYPRMWVNHAPEITTEDQLTAVEDIPYHVNYDAEDPDPLRDTLTWTKKSNEDFLTLDNETGVLTGTPDDSDIGSFWVNISVSDGKGGTDHSNFTLTVSNVNDDPVITNRDREGALAGDHYENFYDATDDDPGGDTLSWSVSTNASFLSMASATGRLHGTPTLSDVGSYRVNVSVSDGNGGIDWSVFTLQVFASNGLPAITTSDITSTLEDERYSVDYNHTDPEGLPPFWSVSTNATFLSIGSLSGILSGTPENDHVGSYWVNVTVEDSLGGEDWSNFTLEVINVNDDPQITTEDQKTSYEDVVYLVDYEAVDVDPTNDTLTWNMLTSCDFLSISGTNGTVAGTPDNDDVASYWVNISVSDGRGGRDWSNFTLEVINVNDDPRIVTDDVPNATEDLEYSVGYSAVDIDPTEDTMTWSLGTNSTFLTIDPKRGSLEGLPTNSDVGSWWVNVSVSDGNGGRDWSNFTLSVLNVNDAPVINTSNLQSALEDSEYRADYDAFDIDPTGDTLIWSVRTNSDFLSMDPTSGVLNGTPDNGDVGQYWVNVTVTDGNGGMDWTNFTLTVVNVNDRPVITSIPPTIATEDLQYYFQMEAYDVDPTMDDLVWSMDTNASFLSVTRSGNISGIPLNEHVGTWLVNVSVTDGNGGEDHHSFQLTVENTNDAPSIYTDPLNRVDEDELYSVTFSALDVDPTNDTLTWSLETDAEFLSIVPGTGRLSGVPENRDVGEWRVNVTVVDGKGGSDSLTYTLWVINTNDPPEIVTTNIETVLEDEIYSVDYQAVDVDPTEDTVEWDLSTDAPFLSMGRRSGSLSGNPGNEHVGEWTVNISVTDDNGGISWTVFILNVLNVNDDPVIESSPIAEIDEDTPYEQMLTASDVDPTNDTLTWSLETDAQFLSIDPATGYLSGVPENEDVGEWIVTIIVSDDKGGNSSLTFPLKVFNTNDDPEIITSNMEDATEDIPYEFTFQAVDPDPTGDRLYWSLDTNASFLEFDDDTATLSGTPENKDVGYYRVNLSVEDKKGGICYGSFQFRVFNVNDPPEVIGQVSSIRADEEERVELDVEGMFRDVDGPALTYHLHAEGGIDIEKVEGSYFLVPRVNWSGSGQLTITANDTFSEASKVLDVKISPVNDAPVIRGIYLNESYTVGEPIVVVVDAIDSDDTDLGFRWSSDVLGFLGEGENLDLELPAGEHNITLTVIDAENEQDSRTFLVKVVEKEEKSGAALFVLIAIIIGALVLLAIIVLSVVLKKRGKSTEEDGSNSSSGNGDAEAEAQTPPAEGSSEP